MGLIINYDLNLINLIYQFCLKSITQSMIKIQLFKTNRNHMFNHNIMNFIKSKKYHMTWQLKIIIKTH